MASNSHGKKAQGTIAILPARTGNTSTRGIRIATGAPCATDAERSVGLQKER
jgi:hypothetical protein